MHAYNAEQWDTASWIELRNINHCDITFITVYSNPACQLSLWDDTGAEFQQSID